MNSRERVRVWAEPKGKASAPSARAASAVAEGEGSHLDDGALSPVPAPPLTWWDVGHVGCFIEAGGLSG